MAENTFFSSIDASYCGSYVCTTLVPDKLQLWIVNNNIIKKVWTRKIDHIKCAIFIRNFIFVGTITSISVVDFNGKLKKTILQSCKHLCYSRTALILGVTDEENVVLYNLQLEDINLVKKLESASLLNVSVNCAALNETGSYLIAGGSSNTIYIFDVKDNVVRTFKSSSIIGIAAHPIEDQFCVISKTQLSVYGITNCDLQYQKNVSDTSLFSSVAYSPDGKYITVAGMYEELFIFYAKSGREKCRKTNVSGQIAISLMYPNKFIRASSENLTVNYFKPRNFTCRIKIYLQNRIRYMAISPKNDVVCFITYFQGEYTFHLYDINTRDKLPLCIPMQSDDEEDILCIGVDFGLDGMSICIIYQDNVIFYDLKGKVLSIITFEVDYFQRFFCISPDKKYLLTNDTNYNINIWDISNTSNPKFINKKQLDVNVEMSTPKMMFSFDNTYFCIYESCFSRSSTLFIFTFELFNNNLDFSMIFFKSLLCARSITAIFARDNRHIFISSYLSSKSEGRSQIEKHSLEPPGSIKEYPQFAYSIKQFDESKCGKYLCYANHRGGIIIFDLEVEKEIFTLSAAVDENSLYELEIVSFSPNNRFIYKFNEGLEGWDSPLQNFTHAARPLFENGPLFSDKEHTLSLSKQPEELVDIILSTYTLKDFY